MEEKSNGRELDDELKELEIIALNEKAENAVAVAVAATATTGAVPIPFADALLLIGEQVILMATLVGKTVATNLLKLF